MRIIQPGYKIITTISDGGKDELKKIELIGRSCYGSEDKITDESAPKFVKGLIDRGHWSPVEHSQLTVMFTIDRGVSHEFVRHRLASFMQSSTRYQNYGSEKYGKEITVIDVDPFVPKGTPAYDNWLDGCMTAERQYLAMLDNGAKPEMARSVLPNSTMTILTITANYREWHHILNLRTGKGAHPQIRAICSELLAELQQRIPVVFDSIDAGDN